MASLLFHNETSHTTKINWTTTQSFDSGNSNFVTLLRFCLSKTSNFKGKHRKMIHEFVSYLWIKQSTIVCRSKWTNSSDSYKWVDSWFQNEASPLQTLHDSDPLGPFSSLLQGIVVSQEIAQMYHHHPTDWLCRRWLKIFTNISLPPNYSVKKYLITLTKTWTRTWSLHFNVFRTNFEFELSWEN